MQIEETKFAGLLIITPTIFEDNRGYFIESYNVNKFISNNMHHVFVQDNESQSQQNVVRGFHYQVGPFAQTKLVRVIKGAVQDVVIDLRQDQPTFGEAFSIKLSAENKKQLLIPRGFAHGFASLEMDSIFAYKCDNVYSHDHERSINILDKSVFDKWDIDDEKMILSEKDTKAPLFKDAEKF